MLVPSKHNINFWKMMICFIIINFELLNGKWQRFNRGYDGFDDCITISRTKSSDITNSGLHSFGNFNQGRLDTWLLNMTISEHIVSLSARTIEGIAQFRTELHKKTRAAPELSTNKKKAHLSIPLKGMCVPTPISFPSLWRWEVHQALFPIG